MKRFTTKEEYPKEYDITKENFEKLTGKREPYYIFSENELKQYAICPLCYNPIQIIGLYHKEENKSLPYGRHAGKEIEGLPSWNYQNYLDCRYKAIRDKYKNPPYEDKLSERQILLYNFVREEIDAIVFVIETTLNIKCSLKFWENILKNFVNSRVCGYVWVSMNNLPYMFMYFSMLQASVYGQHIKIGTPIYNAIEKYPGAKFEVSKYYKGYAILKSTKYIDLSFHFWNYDFYTDNNEALHEEMDFAILGNNNKEIYTEKIVFDGDFLAKVINSKKRERKEKLLEYAREIMPPIIT